MEEVVVVVEQVEEQVELAEEAEELFGLKQIILFGVAADKLERVGLVVERDQCFVEAAVVVLEVLFK